jgi:uncharacterized OsmC-like protein
MEAGLHPATGGDGLLACSGDLLLEALVACAGVTLRAVATAIGIDIQDGTIKAEGDLDFRGTLGFQKKYRLDLKHSGFTLLLIQMPQLNKLKHLLN